MVRWFHCQRGLNVMLSTSHLNGCETKVESGCNSLGLMEICLQQHVGKHRDLISQSCYNSQAASINKPVRSSLTQQSNGVHVCINKLFKRIMNTWMTENLPSPGLNPRLRFSEVQAEVTRAQKRQPTSFPSSSQIHLEEPVTVSPVVLDPIQRYTDGPEQNVRLACCSFTKSKSVSSLFPFI